MIKLYVKLITDPNNGWTIENVPERYKAAVQTELDRIATAQ